MAALTVFLCQGGSTQFFRGNTCHVWTLTTSSLTKLYKENYHHDCFSQRWKFLMISVLLTSELSLQRSDVIAYFTCSVISRHWEVFSLKSFTGASSSNSCHNIRKLNKIPVSVIKIYYWKHNICNRTQSTGVLILLNKGGEADFAVGNIYIFLPILRFGRHGFPSSGSYI